MSERRMFAKSVVQSSKFLKMPVSSRELYFQMGMMADDDGVVEAWNAMMLTKAHEDDLKVLASKGFVQILDNEDMIAYLTDWETNNSIRKDRYHEGVYKELKLQVMGILDNQMTTICQPNDNQTATEVRLGKDSIGKNNISRFAPPTLEEVKSYCSERKNNVDAETFINFYESKGWMIGKNKMKDWKAAVRTWEKKDKAKPKSNSFTERIGEKQDYNFDELERLLQG